MTAPYQSTGDAQTAIWKAIAESGMNRSAVHVMPLQGKDGQMMDEVFVHFPGAKARGSCADIHGAIRDSTSFAELVKICLERDLIERDGETGKLLLND